MNCELPSLTLCRRCVTGCNCTLSAVRRDQSAGVLRETVHRQHSFCLFFSLMEKTLCVPDSEVGMWMCSRLATLRATHSTSAHFASRGHSGTECNGAPTVHSAHTLHSYPLSFTDNPLLLVRLQPTGDNLQPGDEWNQWNERERKSFTLDGDSAYFPGPCNHMAAPRLSPKPPISRELRHVSFGRELSWAERMMRRNATTQLDSQI